MTSPPERATPEREPTLGDVLEQLAALSSQVNDLSTDVKQFDQKFSNYQQATQWVVQLAFTLIASATITVILTSIMR
ncbi:hypothetical protein [Spirulina subsalsa]|uniref:hypothetical protein n=1 Tax=Spirulina subsalsa TaxID=54311 RepID=UPI00031F02AD